MNPGDLNVVPADIGGILKVLRVIRGWKQCELGRAAVVKKSSISDYERGKVVPELATVNRLLRALDFPPSAIEETRQFIAWLMSRPCASARSDRAARVEAVLAEASRMATSFTRQLSLILRDEPELFADASSRPSLPPAEEDAVAEGLWKQLAPLTCKHQAARVREFSEFQSWKLVLLLGAESIAAAKKSASTALERADLGVIVAEGIPGNDPWQKKLRSHAFVCLGNARRVGGNLPSAADAFEVADRLWMEAGTGAPDFLDYGRMLDLKASLRIAERRFPESLALLEEARRLARDPVAIARIILKQGNALEEAGRLEEAITTLEEGASIIEATDDPHLLLCLCHNLLDYLSKNGQAREAHARLEAVQRFARKVGGELDLLRLRWTEARIMDGLGEADRAIGIFSEVRGAFAVAGIAFDTALVSLELTAIYLREGRDEEVKTLASHLVPLFRAQRAYPEALAALVAFRRAAERKQVTAEYVARLAIFLRHARRDPALKFSL